jgi:hypothetical protein
MGYMGCLGYGVQLPAMTLSALYIHLSIQNVGWKLLLCCCNAICLGCACGGVCVYGALLY